MTALSVRPLNPREVALLNEAEETIAAGLTTFIEVGQALLVVRDERLYRRDFATFEDYCVAKWQISRSHAYRLMDAASAVSPIGDTDLPLPMNEAQARALGEVPEERRVEVWGETLDRTGNRPTAAAIAAVANETAGAASGGSPAPAPDSSQPIGFSGEESGESTATDTPEGPPDGTGVPAPRPGVAAPVEEADERPASSRASSSDPRPDVSPAGRGSSHDNLVQTPIGPMTKDFADKLDRLVPNPNPHAEWQLGFLKRVHAVHAVIRSKPEDVAEKADAECLDELRRSVAAFTDYERRVTAAVEAALPENVTPIRRTS